MNEEKGMGNGRITRRQTLVGLFAALGASATRIPMLGAFWRKSAPGRVRAGRGRAARVSPAPHTVMRHG